MKILGKNGYNISYNEFIPKDCNIIIIAMHGFAGDKNSSCIKVLEQKVKEMNIGLIKFDWPGHGESETDGFNLTIDNCLSDLETIISHVKNNYPKANLIAFSTSFGGYLTLLYNYYHKNTFKYIILRSPAIKMYDVMTNAILTTEKNNELKEKKYFNHGFKRNIKVTEEFINQLHDTDLTNLYDNESLTNISIIHGTKDDVAPIDNSIEFVQKHNCSFYPIEGADHRYKKDGELDKVIEITTNILDNIKPTDSH